MATTLAAGKVMCAVSAQFSPSLVFWPNPTPSAHAGADSHAEGHRRKESTHQYSLYNVLQASTLSNEKPGPFTIKAKAIMATRP